MSDRPSRVQLSQPSTGEGAGSQEASLGRTGFNGARTFKKVQRASRDVQVQMRFIERRGRQEHAQGNTGTLRARRDAGRSHMQEQVGRPPAQTKWI